MASHDPKRGHHVINNGVKDLYRDIIEKFVKTFGTTYLRENNYLNLIPMNIINNVQNGGLPVDCVLRAAPLTDQVMKNIEHSTVYTPEGKTYVNHKNAEIFGREKSLLLAGVTKLMRDICHSLKNEKKMPEDLNESMGRLRTFIAQKFRRDVFVDTQAEEWWKEGKGPDDIAELENSILQVEKMIGKIAGRGTIQLVIHWGQWAFRLSEGLDYIRSERLDYTHI